MKLKKLNILFLSREKKTNFSYNLKNILFLSREKKLTSLIKFLMFKHAKKSFIFYVQKIINMRLVLEVFNFDLIYLILEE